MFLNVIDLACPNYVYFSNTFNGVTNATKYNSEVRCVSLFIKVTILTHFTFLQHNAGHKEHNQRTSRPTVTDYFLNMPMECKNALM